MAKQPRKILQLFDATDKKLYSLAVTDTVYQKITDGDLTLATKLLKEYKEKENYKAAFAIMKNSFHEVQNSTVEDNQEPQNDVEGVALRHNDDYVWTRNIPTLIDKLATSRLVDIMKKSDIQSKLVDKKTKNMEVFRNVYSRLSKEGFKISENISDGATRVSQKWRNLIRGYMGYEQKKRKTGEGKLTKPEYYDDMFELMNVKHKFKPVKVHDSLETEKASAEEMVGPVRRGPQEEPENDPLLRPQKRLKPEKTKDKILQILQQVEKGQEERSKRLQELLIENSAERKRTNDLLEKLINNIHPQQNHCTK